MMKNNQNMNLNLHQYKNDILLEIHNIRGFHFAYYQYCMQEYFFII